MTQTQLLRNIQIMRHRQDTSCCLDTFLADDHCPVMQRTVLEENILYQPLVYIGIDHLSRTHNIVQRHIMFNDNQRTDFLFAHTDACHDNRHNFIMLHTLFLIPRKETHQSAGMLMRTECKQEAAYLVLKQNNKRQHPHADQFVEDRPQKLHLQHLRNHQPNQNEHQDARKHVDRTGRFHQFVRIIKQESYQQNVYKIFYAKFKKHSRQ